MITSTDDNLNEVLTRFLVKHADRLTPEQASVAAVFMLGEIPLMYVREEFAPVGIHIWLRTTGYVHWAVEFA